MMMFLSAITKSNFHQTIKKIRFRNLKKDMLVQLDFEISPVGLLAKRIHIQTKMKNNDKQNTKSNKRENADRSKSGYGSY